MKITFLGTGTSQGIPVIACNCAVCRSEDSRDKRLRVSVLVELNDFTLVIDSGPDFRYQMLRAGVKDLDAILYTHEHKDHVAGLDDIRPFNYLLKKDIQVYATERVQTALKREFAYIFEDVAHFGLPKINLHNITNVPFSVGNHTIVPIEAMHFKLPVLGFRINDFTYLTDVKTVAEQELKKIEGTKVLVVNALQREPHISHMTLDEATAFAGRVGAQTTYFTHLSHKLGTHVTVEAALPENIRLAYDGLRISL